MKNHGIVRMKFWKLGLMSVLSVFSLSVGAQNDEKILLSELPYYSAQLKTEVDLEAVAENVVTNLRVVDDETAQTLKNRAKSIDSDQRPVYLVKKWALNREKDATVLHCYLVAGDSMIKNFWLGGDETYIVDTATGVHYKARGSYDKALWNRVFSFDVPRWTAVDVPIYFPPLPESVTDIRIYGVPSMALRGNQILPVKNNIYDSKGPEFKVPKLLVPEKNYDPDDLGTYAVYADVQLVEPMERDYTMAMWRTPETTYLAVAFEQNWTREYFSFEDDIVLIDQKTQKEYKLKKVQGIPMNRMFHIEGCVGDWIAFLLEFEPLPLSATDVTFLAPEGKPFKAWGADWSEKRIQTQVYELLRNQSKFEYAKRKIVK